MKSLKIAQPLPGGAHTIRFAAARAIATTYALSAPRVDRTGRFIIMRDALGSELICRAGATACVPLDEWSSKLT
jgi:hypothetical protein